MNKTFCPYLLSLIEAYNAVLWKLIIRYTNTTSTTLPKQQYLLNGEAIAILSLTIQSIINYLVLSMNFPHLVPQILSNFVSECCKNNLIVFIFFDKIFCTINCDLDFPTVCFAFKQIEVILCEWVT